MKKHSKQLPIQMRKDLWGTYVQFGLHRNKRMSFEEFCTDEGQFKIANALIARFAKIHNISL